MIPPLALGLATLALAFIPAAAGSTAGAAAELLTLDDTNFAEKTSGKVVFIKYFVPWCIHCRDVNAHWEKLAADYEGSESVLVAQVNCHPPTHPPQPSTRIVCRGIGGFPTLLYGEPEPGGSGEDLQEYGSSRDYESLSNFAKENLKPSCSPADRNMHLCNDEEKAIIQRYRTMPPDALAAAIREVQKKVGAIEEERAIEIEALESQYDEQLGEIKMLHNFKLMTQVRQSRIVRGERELDYDDDDDDDDDDTGFSSGVSPGDHDDDDSSDDDSSDDDSSDDDEDPTKTSEL